MTEARVGRLVPACLHQAIQETLPRRLDFYEHWLHSQALHDGSIGLAPMTAVLGFLRTEGEGYDQVVRRAGALAAEWTVASMSPFRRRLLAALPSPMRVRAAMRVAADIVREVSSDSHARRHVARARWPRSQCVALLRRSRQAIDASLRFLRGDHGRGLARVRRAGERTARALSRCRWRHLRDGCGFR